MIQALGVGVELVELGDGERLEESARQSSCRWSRMIHFPFRNSIIRLSQSFEKGITFDLEKLQFLVAGRIVDEIVSPLHGISDVFTLGPIELIFESMDVLRGSNSLKNILGSGQLICTVVLIDQDFIKILSRILLAIVTDHGDIRIIIYDGLLLHELFLVEEVLVLSHEFGAHKVVIETRVDFEQLIDIFFGRFGINFFQASNLVNDAKSCFDLQEERRIAKLLSEVLVELFLLLREVGEAALCLCQVQEVQMVIPLGAWNQAIDGVLLLLFDHLCIIRLEASHHISLVGFQTGLVEILLSELVVGGILLDLIPQGVFGELVDRLAPIQKVHHF